MTFSTDETIALIIAVSFAAGLNVPGTVATLGVLSRAGVIALPVPLEVLSDWWVIGLSAGVFAFEFVADKIAGFDLIWNALQTFVRVPAGALLAWSATTSLSPKAQIFAALAGAAISLLAHSGKLAVRGAVSASPEPFSNIAVSVVEDVTAIGLTWFATTHPFLAAGLVLVMLTGVVLTLRWAVRALRAVFTRRAGSADRLASGAPASVPLRRTSAPHDQ
jgi:hypothetical protein